MKSKYIILVFGILLLFACKNEEDHTEELSESDLIALEGMEENYEAALRYNDSLAFCMNGTLDCDSSTMLHYDEMFHQFDDMFNFHHENFSHNNDDDDHHHDDGQTVWHGNMMGHGGDPHEDDGHGYEHNNETFEEMMHLRELHDEIHPK